MKRIFIIFLIVAGCISQQNFLIEECSPQQETVTINSAESVEFSCTANAEATYTWYVNNTQTATTPFYTFSKPAGNYTVTVKVTDGSKTLSHQWTVTVTESPDFEIIQQKVEQIRNLKFTEPVNKVIIDREQMRENFIEGLEEDKNDILIEQELYVALHVWDRRADLYNTYIEVLTVQVASYYDTEEHIYYEVVEPGAPLAYREFIAAHELVHALQDQNQYLDWDSENDDEYLAFLCVVEGDAMFHQISYLRGMTQQETESLFSYVQSMDIPVINLFLENLLTLRYELGMSFVATMSSSGIDKLYERLPVSTEQVMHPDKYRADERPIAVDIPSLSGWESVAQNTLGEAFIMTFLKEHISREQATEAAAGWGGDSYGYYKKEKDYILVVNTFWDTEVDAAEFHQAYYDFTLSWSNGDARKITENTYETPTGYLALIEKGTQVIIVESTSLEAIDTVLLAMACHIY